MNPLSGETIPFSQFTRSGNQRFYKTDARIDAAFERLKNLEDFQLGTLPWRVRVINTNRVNSILKVEDLTWTRQPSPIAGEIKTVTELTKERVIEQARRYDYNTRRYEPYDEEVQWIYGSLSANEGFRTRSNCFKLVHDGVDVTKSIPRNAQFEVLLGSNESTILYEPNAGLSLITFTDRFGEVIKAKDMVVFMTCETLKIGNVARFLPRGGMVLKTIEGSEHKIMNPHTDTVLKIDSKLPDRVMMAKLSSLK